MVATATTKAPRKTAANKPAGTAAALAAEAEEVQGAEVPEKDSQKRNRLRNEAERHILNLHKDEFDDYAEKLFADNGLTFNRRLSEAQKAEKKIEALIAEHPELADALRAKLTAPAEAPVVHSTGQWTDSEDAPAVDYSAEEEGYVDPFQQS